MRIGPLLALTVATFALGFGELMLAGILPEVARDLRVTLSAAGQLVGMYALTFACVSWPLAVALGRLDRRTVLLVALVVVTLANVAAAFGTTFAFVLAMRVIAAIGSAAATTLALAMVDVFADDATRGRAHGIVFAGFAAAATFGVPIGVVLADHWSWRYAFAGVGASAFGAAILAAVVVPPTSAAQVNRRRDVLRIEARRTVVLRRRAASTRRRRPGSSRCTASPELAGTSSAASPSTGTVRIERSSFVSPGRSSNFFASPSPCARRSGQRSQSSRGHSHRGGSRRP